MMQGLTVFKGWRKVLWGSSCRKEVTGQASCSQCPQSVKHVFVVKGVKKSMECYEWKRDISKEHLPARRRRSKKWNTLDRERWKVALRSQRVYITLYSHSRTDDESFGRVIESETGATIEFLETRLLLAKTSWKSCWRSRAWGENQSFYRCEILKINTSLICCWRRGLRSCCAHWDFSP